MKVPAILTIQELRKKYANGELTPGDVIDEIIRRAKADEQYNIWITPPSNGRIQKYLDALDEMDLEDYPLWGIPFAVKDNIDVHGWPTTAACPDYQYAPEEHASVVQRLVAAGAIPVGKCNLDQFATGLVGMRSPFGETCNSLRGELISGGSSSGSAVAVARGQAAFALGTDTAGSGRVPAALNRLVGLKPSLGAWPTRGVVPACASLDCVTVFGHTLADALAVDAAVRGVDERDPWSRHVPPPALKLPAQLCLPRGPLRFFGPYEAAYRKAWHTAVTRIESMGLPVKYVDIGIFTEAAKILYDGPWVAERWSGLGSFVEDHPDSLLPVTERILRSGASASWTASSLFQATHQLQRYKLEARKLLQDSVLVMPTCGGTWTRQQVRDEPFHTNSEMGIYTNHCNLLDLCAIAVPADDADIDLPFGITMFGLSEQEGLMIAAADKFSDPNRIFELNHINADNTVEIAVCGLHMRGYPLEAQMLEHGALFVKEAKTAPRYALVKLTGSLEKPGLIKRSSSGEAAGSASIELEIWEMPARQLGRFLSLIPAPLSLGKIELEDHSEVIGFLCEAYAAETAEDISHLGAWKKASPIINEVN
ncbi:Allophanate hydrolase [compost metagenome]